MKSRFVKDLNRLNISDTPHVTVHNTLLYKSPQIKPSLRLPFCWFCNELNCYTMSVPSSMKWRQFTNTQRPQTIHSEHDNKIKPNCHTASLLWQVHFPNYHAYIKISKTSSVNLPFTEVSTNTTFHPNEISGSLKNAIYAFTVLWCRAEEVGSWSEKFQFNTLSTCSEIKQSN